MKSEIVLRFDALSTACNIAAGSLAGVTGSIICAGLPVTASPDMRNLAGSAAIVSAIALIAASKVVNPHRIRPLALALGLCAGMTTGAMQVNHMGSALAQPEKASRQPTAPAIIAPPTNQATNSQKLTLG